MSDMMIQISVNAAGLKKGVDEAQAKLKQVPDKKVTKLDGDANGLKSAIATVENTKTLVIAEHQKKYQNVLITNKNKLKREKK